MDGDLGTSWLADKNLEADQRWLELRLRRPLRGRSLRLYPHADARGVTESVGVSENGGGERTVALKRGWNEIELSGRPLSSLRIRIGKVRGEERGRGGGGIDELELPGLSVRETLRLPVEAAREARGADLSHTPIEVLLERTTADFPSRAGADVANPQARSPLDAVDPERGLVPARDAARAPLVRAERMGERRPDRARRRARPAGGRHPGGRGADAQLEPLRGRAGEPRVVGLRRRPATRPGSATACRERRPGSSGARRRRCSSDGCACCPAAREHATPSRVRLSAASGSRDAAVVEGTAVTLPVGRDGVVEPDPAARVATASA